MTGIPEFWLTVFKNVEMLSEMVQVCIDNFSDKRVLFQV